MATQIILPLHNLVKYIVASNGVDAPQYYLMGTSTNFANLSSIATSGTVPVFKVSGVSKGFFYNR